MASRAEHYREAERRLEDALDAEGGSDNERYLLGAASVHALLANAAGEVAAAPGEVPGAGGPSPRTVTFDLTDAVASFVLTQALEEFAARERDQAAHEGSHESRERWADLADQMRGQVEAAG